MILLNKSKRLISINCSPKLSDKEIAEYTSKKIALPKNFVNIAPLEQMLIDDNACNNDFVQNLLNIGDLEAVVENKNNLKKTKNVVSKKTQKEEKKILAELQDQASLANIDYKDWWTIEELRHALDKHKSS